MKLPRHYFHCRKHLHLLLGQIPISTAQEQVQGRPTMAAPSLITYAANCKLSTVWTNRHQTVLNAVLDMFSCRQLPKLATAHSWLTSLYDKAPPTVILYVRNLVHITMHANTNNGVCSVSSNATCLSSVQLIQFQMKKALTWWTSYQRRATMHFYFVVRRIWNRCDVR